MSHFSKKIIVTQCECDFQNHMKASSLLRQVQQIGTDHCDSVGITAETYQKTHTAFLLAKLSLEIYEAIPVQSTLNMVTKPSVPIRAVYQRYTSLYNEQGREVAAVDARWVLVDTDTRRILRKTPDSFQFPFLDEKEKEQDVTVHRLEPVITLDPVKAVYSRCDQNGHMNNAEYADVVCDCLPISLFQEKRLSKLVLCYHNELPLGSSMALEMSASTPTAGGMQYYFRGHNGDKLHFDASICFC